MEHHRAATSTAARTRSIQHAAVNAPLHDGPRAGAERGVITAAARRAAPEVDAEACRGACTLDQSRQGARVPTAENQLITKRG